MGFALSTMQLVSPAFRQGGRIPAKYTGEGENVSPPLSWSGAPSGTRSFAVICHDPDAPLISKHGTYGFVHWVLYNIPAATNSLDEGTTAFTAGKNDFGKTGYGGPMPPDGHGDHHYYFWILALDHETQLEGGLELWELLQEIEPRVTGMNRLMGIYARD